MTRKGDIITLNISGVIFKTRQSTFQSIPGSRLAQLDKVETKKGQMENSLFFDRDPDCFKSILNAYRDRELHMPKDICPKRFQKELEFWKLPIHLLSPCCWETFYKADQDLSITAVLLQQFQKRNYSHNQIEDDGISLMSHSLQLLLRKEETAPENKPSKLWLFLDEPASSPAAKVIQAMLERLAVYELIAYYSLHS